MATGAQTSLKAKRGSKQVPREKKPRSSAHVLNDEARAFIVTSLACYTPTCQIQREVLTRFDREISHQAIACYNPETAAAKTIAARWVTLFYATREKLMDELAEEPIANRKLRLRRLWNLHDAAYAKAMEGGPAALAASEEARALLEQAAKEVGGLLTNQRQISGKVDHSHAVSHTIDEKRNELEDALAEALARRARNKPQPAPTVQ